MQHPLKFVQRRGKLAEALGIPIDDPMAAKIESIVEHHISIKANLRELLQTVGELDISDELWANFLYTFGFWQGQQNGA